MKIERKRSEMRKRKIGGRRGETRLDLVGRGSLETMRGSATLATVCF
jgi:hypothetical protein